MYGTHRIGFMGSFCVTTGFMMPFCVADDNKSCGLYELRFWKRVFCVFYDVLLFCSRYVFNLKSRTRHSENRTRKSEQVLHRCRRPRPPSRRAGGGVWWAGSLGRRFGGASSPTRRSVTRGSVSPPRPESGMPSPGTRATRAGSRGARAACATAARRFASACLCIA